MQIKQMIFNKKITSQYIPLNLAFPKSYALSLPEVLLALIIIGILGVSTLKSIVALKKQDKSIQSFLLHQSNLFETQLFLNKYFSLSKPNSFSITQNAISWKSYDNLFLPQKNSEIMDYSLQVTPHILTLQNNTLYFDNFLLLHDASLLQAHISNTKTHKILTYKLCAKYCINDFIILEESEIIL